MAEKTITEIAKLCADCGTCQSACPVYQAELSEPNSPRGKVNLIKAIDDDRLTANHHNRNLLYQCLVCGGCESACPNGVEFNSLMISHRNRISGGSHIPWFKKTVLFFYQGFVLRKLLWLPRLLAHTPLKRKLALPSFLPANLKRVAGSDREREYDVLLFPGCVLTYFYPQKVVEIKSLLEKQGLSVLYPPGLQCCGFPYLSQGWGKKIHRAEEKERGDLQEIPFQEHRRPLLYRSVGFQEILRHAREGNLRVKRLSVQIPSGRRGRPGLRRSIPRAPFTYHDPCHNLKSLKLQKEARHFLRTIRRALPGR